MAIKTVDYVKPDARSWTNDEGKTFYFVEAIFDDGSEGSVFCFSQPNAEETMTALREQVGKAAEFDLQAGKEYNGKMQWKIKGFPGKPVGGGGGGGGGRGGGGMSHSQAGIMAAASALSTTFAAQNIDVPDVMAGMIVELGEKLTEHLFARRPPETAEQSGSGEVSGGAPTSQTAAPAATPAANKITLPQMARVKELAASRGIEPDLIASTIGVERLGDMTTEEAQTLIDGWS